MFGRNKNRESKLPVPAPLNDSTNLQAGGAALGRRFSGFRKKSPVPSPVADATPSLAPTQQEDEDDVTPVATPHQQYDHSYDPSVNSLSRVDTNDAHEAHQAFSSFDQGPLEDVPAFVPESPRRSEESEAAVPPPITRHRSDEGEGTGEDLTKEVSPVVSDRWAQIRKNAAERAARQSEEQSRGGYSGKTDGDDGETSGEESKLPRHIPSTQPVLTESSNRIPRSTNQSPRR
jgi:hypothetical protein